MLKKKIPSTLLVVALLFSLVAFSVTTVAHAQEEETTFTFTDVPEDHPARAAIEYCAENKFVLGYGDNTFKPDGKITREQFVTIWARTFHARMHDFSDATKTKDEMDNAIVLMYGLGFINGVSSTRFSRMDNITREQVAQIVKNTYLPGVDGNDMYTSYEDSEAISEWARDAVSVIREKGIFSEITENNKFEPKKDITRAEVCMVVYNLMNVMPVKYTISVHVTGDGAITANKTTAAAGETVTLTITPNEGSELIAGTLKVNDTAITGTKFTMPAENVIVTAEFDVIAKLDSIEIQTTPKTEYVEGETLDTTGLVLTANYTNAESREITENFTTDPAEGTELTVDHTGDVSVSYTENGITKTTEYSITVVEDEEES